jgi:hypothetical protein
MNLTRFQRTARLVIAGMAVAALALTLTLPAAGPVQAAGLRNCADITGGQLVGCYELVWSDGVEYRMTFSNLHYNGATPRELDPFYVLAPQTDTPQGTVPFLHDHVVGDVPTQNHGDYSVQLQGFFVFCSALGIGTGACVPTWTLIPGFGTVPFATTVNGQPLTSASAIESAAAAGLVAPINLGPGAVIVGTISGN